MKIAFIGLGIMGSKMALHLIENKVALSVYNRTSSAADVLVSKGATLAGSPQEAVKNADIVFSMLSTPAVVESVFFGSENVLQSMKKNAIWADCTTVNPTFSLKAQKEAEKYGIRFLDAPVSGSKPQAANAELLFLVGGKQEILAEVTPYMDMMGKKIMHIGDAGKGSSFKMIVNMVLAQSMLVYAEAVLLGNKMGIPQDFLLEVLPALHVASPFTKFKAENIRNDRYDVQFPLEWMLKDLNLASLSASELDQPLYMANMAKEIFNEANLSGMGRLDFSSIYKYLNEKK